MRIRPTDYDADDFEYAEKWEKFKKKKDAGPAPERQEDRRKRIRRPKEDEIEKS